MHTVEVDFEVFKNLTFKRTSEDHTVNDVLREMLDLPALPKGAATGKKSWTSEDVVFPHGTEFRGTRKGNTYTAHIDDGQLLVNGQVCAGFSPAVKAATGKGENGWTFWRCKRPGDTDFALVDQFRKKK
jgi:hypothetical protein